MIGSLQLALPLAGATQLRLPRLVPSRATYQEIHSTLITWQPIRTTLPKLLNADSHASYCPSFVLPLFSPIRIAVDVVSFKTANHSSICDFSPLWRWAYDYFWLCVGAYSSDWSSAAAGTSAPLILTHDPCIRHKSINGAASGARPAISTHFVSLCSCWLKPLAVSSFPG